MNLKSFYKDIAVTFSGSAFAVIVGFLATPILSRLYTPEDFGVFRIFVALSLNISLLATLRFPMAIPLPKGESDFLALAKTCLIFIVFFSGLGLFFFSLFAAPLCRISNIGEQFAPFLFLIPVLYFFTSINELLFNINVRTKAFKRNASAEASGKLFDNIIKIATGYFINHLGIGLIVCQALFLGFKSCVLRLKSLVNVLSFPLSKATFLDTLRTFKGFPLYILPGNFINQVSQDVPLYFLAFYYNNSVVGNFSFASILLLIPFNLISNSITPVFFQKATELFQSKPLELKVFAEKIFNQLLKISVVPFACLTFFGDLLVPIFLGEQWEEAGVFACFIASFLIFRILFTPLAPIFRVLQQERFILIIGVVLLASRCTALWIGLNYFSYFTAILMFAIASALSYIFGIAVIFKLVEIPIQFFLKGIAKITIPVFLFSYLLRLLIDSIFGWG